MQIYLSAEDIPTQRRDVADLREASRALQQFRDTYQLGASQMREGCGDVYQGNAKVARVSYNGRVWSPSGELLQEAANDAR